MKKIKKILSLFLVICLFVSTVSISANAAIGDRKYDEGDDQLNDYPESATILYNDFTIMGTIEVGDNYNPARDYFCFEIFETSKVNIFCGSEYKTLIGGIIDANTLDILHVFKESSYENIYTDSITVTLPAGKYLILLGDKHIDNYYEYEYVLYFEYQDVEAELVYESGKWCCLIDGEYTNFTGLINIKGKQHYIRNGYFTGASGLVTISGKKMYINKGYFTGASGLVTINGKKMYINKGYFTGASGLVTLNGKKTYINKGYFTGASGLVTISGKKAYINKGYFTGATGIVKISGKKYYIKKGYAQTKFSGKVKISGKTYTVKKGIVK